MDIDNAERDEDQHREILIAAAMNISLVANQTAVAFANTTNNIIKSHVKGGALGVPIEDSFFGRLKTIQEDPKANNVSVLAVAIGIDR